MHLALQLFVDIATAKDAQAMLKEMRADELITLSGWLEAGDFAGSFAEAIHGLVLMEAARRYLDQPPLFAA